MDIYTRSDELSSDIPYFAKRLLDDSVDRTSKGFQNIYDGRVYTVLTGTANIMLARVESAFAFAIAPLGILGVVREVIYSSFQCACFVPANVFTRIPVISSFESMKKINKSTSDTLYRTARVYLKIIPVVTLFTTVAAINTVIPGAIRAQGAALNLIHYCVESLGPLQYVRAISANGYTVVGTKKKLDYIDCLEEFCRAFSSKNYVQELRVPSLRHFHTEVITLYV